MKRFRFTYSLETEYSGRQKFVVEVLTSPDQYWGVAEAMFSHCKLEDVEEIA